jgi:hypothetical protein
MTNSIRISGISIMTLNGISTLFILLLLFVSTAAATNDDSWSNRIKLQGDMRLRYEGIDEDFAVNRRRARFRTRVGLSATVNDDVKFVFRLASGGNNPVSTNQSFDSGFSTKDIGIDLAYIDWTVSDQLKLYAGKIKNPLFRAGGVPLIWDGDLNPEGVALKYGDGGFFGTAGVYSVEERSSGDDSLLFALQAGYTFRLAEGMTLTTGAGYFAYSNTVGNAAFFNGRSQGNTLDSAGNYVHDYKNSELFVEFGTKIADWPLKIYLHATRNNEVSTQDTAYAIGVELGSAKVAGDRQFSWTYQDIEADAVIATFNDSDFGGGGTDADGHLVKAKYAYRKNVFLSATLFLNNVDRFQGTEHDFSRFQLDVEFKFN